MIKVGDIVSRNKYNNDTLFRVEKIEDNICYLCGLSIRLCADSELSDLRKEDDVVEDRSYEEEFLSDLRNDCDSYRSDFFYIPGKILHIDGDNEYLQRCLRFYKSAGITAYGVYEKEETLYLNILKYLKDIKPDIVIITGHDAYYSVKGNTENQRAYKNSDNFAKAVKIARNYEKSYDKLKIIAGACQSNYEELIKAGANFASSPKKVNIHALDPAIIAVSISRTENTKELNIIDLLNKTKCGKDGIGGIKSYGSMYVGYPKQGWNMIETIKQELSKYKDKKVKVIINEGRSRKRKEYGIIKNLYNRTFTLEVNGVNVSFSYADVIMKTIIINLV